MNDFIFSPSQNIIFPTAYKDAYIQAGSWPADGVPVSNETAAIFNGQFPMGKLLGHDENNQPCWVDAPPPSQSDLITLAEHEKSARLQSASTAIAPLQDAADLDITTGDEKELLLEWKKYRVLLNRVDTSTAPDIKWPIRPGR